MRILFRAALFSVLFCVSARGAGLCSKTFKPATVRLTDGNLRELIKDPEKNLDKVFVDESSSRPQGTPFRIALKTNLPLFLREPLQDIEILSRNPLLREKVFGNSGSQRILSTGLLDRPLSLKAQDDGRDAGFVEVGFEALTLNTGERLYVYGTSNHKNGIDFPYAHLSDLVAEVKQAGKTVVQVDSFHTHPVNLVPSIMDKEYFRYQLSTVKAEHPEVDFTDWTMRTTMELEPVVHEVHLSDWSLKP